MIPFIMLLISIWNIRLKTLSLGYFGGLGWFARFSLVLSEELLKYLYLRDAHSSISLLKSC